VIAGSRAYRTTPVEGPATHAKSAISCARVAVDRCPPADLARCVSRTQMDQSELLGGCSGVPEFVLRRLSATSNATKQGGAESVRARIVGEASTDKDHRLLAGPYVRPDEGEREAGVLPALHGGGDEDSRHPSKELDCLVTR